MPVFELHATHTMAEGGEPVLTTKPLAQPHALAVHTALASVPQPPCAAEHCTHCVTSQTGVKGVPLHWALLEPLHCTHWLLAAQTGVAPVHWALLEPLHCTHWLLAQTGVEGVPLHCAFVLQATHTIRARL